MTLVYWRGSSFFWENANVFVFSFIMYGAFMFLNATFTKNEAPDEVGTKIILINQASVWILAWLALAILGFYFKPDLNIAQLGFFLIGLGFLVPPYVPADRRVRAAQSIPRRIGYGVLLVLLVADLFL
ncbi:MAG: hypothetical protein L3J37_01095 [Rhodobacteraceae bacterium]|nr:hypothetical protein [Paracoccaceae bacterium]